MTALCKAKGATTNAGGLPPLGLLVAVEKSRNRTDLSSSAIRFGVVHLGDGTSGPSAPMARSVKFLATAAAILLAVAAAIAGHRNARAQTRRSAGSYMILLRVSEKGYLAAWRPADSPQILRCLID